MKSDLKKVKQLDQLWSKVAGTEIRLESLYWPPFERKTSKQFFLGNSKGRGLTWTSQALPLRSFPAETRPFCNAVFRHQVERLYPRCRAETRLTL